MDREKVVKGLNDIGGFIAGRIGIEQARNFLRTLDEAIAMLKEQEAMLIVRKWHKSELGDYSRLHCPKCDHEIEKPTFLERNETSYCPYCGQVVKWK